MNKKSSAFLIFKRAFTLALDNFRRNTLLSVATISVMAILIFIFNVLLTVNVLTKEAIAELNKKADLVVYLKESTAELEIKNLLKSLRSIKGVSSVDYTNKDEALKEMQKSHPKLSLALEKYEIGNPLPASISISSDNPETYRRVLNFLEKPQITAQLAQTIDKKTAQENQIISSVSNNLLQVNDFTEKIIFWTLIIFISGGVLLIFNALNLTIFTRKEEVSVMKLVGAPYSMIIMPFVIESVLYAIIATILGFSVLYAVSQHLSLFLPNIQEMFLMQIGIITILSIFSSFWALKIYLAKREI